MCKSELHNFLHALPKCEHHMHVEGALMPALLFELATRNSITLPPGNSAYKSEEQLLARYKRFTSLDDFLKYYYIGMSVLITVADFEDLAWSYFSKAHADGVVHAEIFFDPQAHIERGISYTTVIQGLSNACKRAQTELSMSTELICCFLRHLPPAAAVELFHTSEVQSSLKDGSVVGIGLDSSENQFPPELFADLYAAAGATGVKLTAHAGEEGPAVNIATAVNMLKCHRIDHGVRLAEDLKLVENLAAKSANPAQTDPSFLLTVCPLSNVFLHNIPRMEDLPIMTFLENKIPFSINSDDPAYFGGFILDNYCAVQEAFNLSVQQWHRICSNAIAGSWCELKRKSEIQAILDKVCQIEN